jgi:uncharacterized membrane protein YdbT with pleckstrin-like domain
LDYIESNLVPGEKVLYKTRLHWIVLIWPVLMGLVLGGAGSVFVIGGYEASGKGNSYPGMIIVGLFFVVGAAILLGVGLIRKNSTEVAVSNKRVLIKTGFITRKSIEVLLLKVESIGVNESFLGQALGYGSVVTVASEFHWLLRLIRCERGRLSLHDDPRRSSRTDPTQSCTTHHK